jgi:GDP-L-fucose synthase
MVDLRHKRITVTGGRGFLGRYVVRELEKRGCRRIDTFSSRDYNLVLAEDVKRMYDDLKPDIVIHLAARVAASAKQENPRYSFYDNSGWRPVDTRGFIRKIEKFVADGTTAPIRCSRLFPSGRKTYGTAIPRNKPPLRLAKR